jgi:hypothetical protein
MTRPDLSVLSRRQRAGIALHGFALKLNPGITVAIESITDQKAADAITKGRYVQVPEGVRAVMVSDASTAQLNATVHLYDICVMDTPDPKLAHLLLREDKSQEFAAAKWLQHVASTAAQQ